MPQFTRRRFLQGSAGLLAGCSVSMAARGLALTPRQPAGPFYPTEPPLDDDNDLTQVGDSTQRARGRIADLGGRILDRNGTPLPGLRMEIWQCDANGRYRHPRDSGHRAIDPGFQG
ncbi:MAG: hypothetical protein R3308_10295, partial [Thiohalobacterales bacterium]|nr:hypothetical protein [Thiohalobacterales bacterium]